MATRAGLVGARRRHMIDNAFPPKKPTESNRSERRRRAIAVHILVKPHWSDHVRRLADVDRFGRLREPIPAVEDNGGAVGAHSLPGAMPRTQDSLAGELHDTTQNQSARGNAKRSKNAARHRLAPRTAASTGVVAAKKRPANASIAAATA